MWFVYCATYSSFMCCRSASVDDANRSIELKNGTVVGGRKIGVKQAIQRAPREQRRSKGDQGLCFFSFIFCQIQ